MKNSTLALMMISFTLSVILNFLLNLATGYLATDLQPYKNAIYLGLGVIFAISLALFLWEQMRSGNGNRLRIAQTAKSGGQIVRSPLAVNHSTGVEIEQRATASGTIVDSKITATEAADATIKQQATGEKSKIEGSDITIT